MKLSSNILKQISECLKGIAPEAEAYLYGSHARGTAREDSDVDLLILIPDIYQGQQFAKKKLDISGRLYDLSLMLGIDISPLILVPKVFFARKTPFTSNVLKDAIRI